MKYANLRNSFIVAGIAILAMAIMVAAQLPGTDARLTNDDASVGGYVSTYTLATGKPYSDSVLSECSVARGRQNEPSIAVDPRNTNVLIGSSNDYCGVYAGSTPGNFVPSGPIWLGYYRSENGGSSFLSSLVPGYPGDTSPYAALSNVRTANAGDPVVAWDNHGRVFMGAESSDDPAGSKKSFGDVWVARFDNPDGENGNPQNDGKRFRGSEIVARGSSAPNYLGKFNDKTAIEVDRTGGSCDGNVYFAYSRFTGNGGNAIYFARSTDHGATWSQPKKLSASIHGVQDPDIAVTGNGNVYVTFRQFASQSGEQDAVVYVKSTNCGQSFSPPRIVATLIPYEAQDVVSPEPISMPESSLDDPNGESEGSAPGSTARDCGDFSNHCQSGYTFFRRDTAPRATADQYDKGHELIYIVYDPSKPGTQVSTGTTYGSIRPGLGSQSGIYFIRLDGATGKTTAPMLIDNQSAGHQFFPDISADGGILHVIWWDSRLDPAYSPMRPVGNDASGKTFASLDVWAAKSNDAGSTWTNKTRVTDFTSNPNYEQFGNRTAPFAGDYLWVTSLGNFSYGAWTDWRNTVAGADPREATEDEDGSTSDVKQCRTYDPVSGTWSSDQCPHDGGLDQNIYGDHTP